MTQRAQWGASQQGVVLKVVFINGKGKQDSQTAVTV